MPAPRPTSGPPLPTAVLWDMDGTLVDTEPLWNAAQQALLAEYGGVWSEALAASLVGRPLDEGARRLQAAGIGLDVEQIIARTMGEVAAAIADAVPWRPGALELLRKQSATGVPGALVTMSHAPLARVLAEHAPDGALTVVVTGDQARAGKPDPEAYRLALHRLGEHVPGLDPADCVAVEDSPVGVRAAVTAGLPTVGVPSVLPLPAGVATVEWDTLAGRTLADLAAVRPGPAPDGRG
ncbi:HAD family phosphatase [Micrococcus sp.]|uniref:HAD family hydrolase n=1 Tax=Micrococcus sp. TaxID=1271 RepID=UPI002A908D2E|nr:HAD family phosphatase [Micrococcus sp.]MDY6055396.1 HAD family phosphatase [Micrococcus sp.]